MLDEAHDEKLESQKNERACSGAMTTSQLLRKRSLRSEETSSTRIPLRHLQYESGYLSPVQNTE